MNTVSEAIRGIQSTISKIERVVDLDIQAIKDMFDAPNLERMAREQFTHELQDFVKRLGGDVLPLDGHTTLVHDLFVRYFDQLPPFEDKDKKKNEFPDAASLLMLESYARNNDTKGIVVSGDHHWAAFAKKSDYLYCVNSLEELVALFKSKGDMADKVKKKLIEKLSDPASNLTHLLEAALKEYVDNMSWEEFEAALEKYLDPCENINSINSGWTEARVNQAKYHHSDVDKNRLELWLVEDDPTVCTVEITAITTVDLDIGIESFQYDIIDHEEIGMGPEKISFPEKIPINLLLMCRGNLLGTPVDNWDDINIIFKIEGSD